MVSYIQSKASIERNALRDDIITEIAYHIHRFEFHQRVGLKKEEELDDSMHFGEIATEFLIRYKNYSLIDFCNKPIILTAQDNCGKKFDEYIQRGYYIFRLSKLYYENETFYKLPVLPSEEDWIDEIIEAPNGSYVQMSKYASTGPSKERKR